MKAYTEKNLRATKATEIVFDEVANIVGKGENTGQMWLS